MVEPLRSEDRAGKELKRKDYMGTEKGVESSSASVCIKRKQWFWWKNRKIPNLLNIVGAFCISVILN
jgi:hypothetical protein